MAKVIIQRAWEHGADALTIEVREWCPSTQVHPYTADNARINAHGCCILCGHHGPVTKTGQLRRHKR